jgi:hypothetical protein
MKSSKLYKKEYKVILQQRLVAKVRTSGKKGGFQEEPADHRRSGLGTKAQGPQLCEM